MVLDKNSRYSNRQIEILWDHFADVPINPETERLDEDFFRWKQGTDREEIWHWFDQHHSQGVYYLLYEYDAKDENWKDYQKFKLEWMLSHGYSLEDLIHRVSEILQEETTLNLSFEEAFKIFENEVGFAGSEIWPCYDEWLNEEKVLDDEETIGFLKELFEAEEKTKNGFEKEME